MSDEEKDVDDVDEEGSEDDGNEDLEEEQGILVDKAVAELMEDGMFSGGDGYEIKCLIVANDPKSAKKINDFFGDKDKRGLLRIRSIQETIVSEKTIFIWYYE